MIKINRKILPIFLLVTCISSHALQSKMVKNNETTSVKISATDVTRVFIEGDRIKSVRGVKGAYSRENDEKNGEIYIQPTPLYQNRPFTVLIDTEKGHHFTLLVTPTFSPSESLMLIPQGVSKEAAKQFEQASSYELTLTHLMKAMKNKMTPSGYAVHEITEHKRIHQFGDQLQVKLKTLYQGLSLKGEIYEITNKSPYTVQLDEREFYKTGVRAISLDSINIASKKKIQLYRIMSHD